MNILYIMSTYNLYGGTPKKTLDLMKHFREKSTLYLYHEGYKELKKEFENTNANIYEGYYKRNIYLHVKKLIAIIDKHDINIVQTQFTMGEVLGYFIKILRPHVKLIVAFVGALETKGIKKKLTNIMYKKVDTFIFISEYVKREKLIQYPFIKDFNSHIIYNGTEKRVDTQEEIIRINAFSLLCVSSLIKLKNIEVIIEALNIIINQHKIKDIFFYVAGEGEYRSNLEHLIHSYSLEKNIFLLGHQKNIGRLLTSCDIYVHPCYAEGFGIAVAEAMIAKKPIIVSNKGALPELITDGKSGYIVDYKSPEEWVEKIILLRENENIRTNIAKNANQIGTERFSINKYVENYTNLYSELIK